MNNSIQASSSAGAGVQKTSSVSLESSNSPADNDNTTGFTSALASAESESTENNSDKSASETLPADDLADGKSLPAKDNTDMWHSLFGLMPAEKSSLSELTAINVFDSKAKSVVNTEIISKDYFTLMSMQSKSTSAALPAVNYISMQLVAAQFIPENSDAVLLNMSEQIPPAQGTNSILSQSLAAVGLGTATQAAVTQTQMAPLNLAQNAWQNNLGSRLQMMIGQNVQTAEIRLDPPELGTIEIKIKIINDVATINITSAHAHVREVLETSIPKLREMFSESGVELGDVNVRQESFSQQQSEAEQSSSNISSSASQINDEPEPLARKIVSDNLLDIYA